MVLINPALSPGLAVVDFTDNVPELKEVLISGVSVVPDNVRVPAKLVLQGYL
jgi:hypothetical protein